jgi:exonuclease SbcD
MRLLHTADWHLGRSLEGRDRTEEFVQFLDELNEIAEQEKVDAVLIAGDIYDSVNPPAVAEQLFYENLSRLSKKGERPVIIIAGNHDNPERLSASSPLASEYAITLLGYPTVQLQKIAVPSTQEYLEIAALPYPSESRLHELLTEEQDSKNLQIAYNERVRSIFSEMNQQFSQHAVRIAMSHLFVAGGHASDSERPIEVGGAYTVHPSSFPIDAHYVALGHLHRPQTMQTNTATGRYSGSPLALSFSEAGYAKSVTIIDVQSEGSAQVREIFLSSGKPLVRWKATDGISQVYKWIDEDRDMNTWIDLEIHLEQSLSLEDIHRLRKLRKDFVHIRPIFPDVAFKKENVSLSNQPIDELFRRFYEKQTGGARAQEELVKLFLELLQEEEQEEVAPIETY